MKSTVAWLSALIVFLLVLTSPVEAQYVVKSGETLWGIAEKNLDAPTSWKRIYNSNSFLMKRRFIIDEKGRIIVKIYPGEVLSGVDKAGFVDVRPATLTEIPVKQDLPTEVIGKNNYDSSLFFWLALALGLLLVGLWFYKKNPTQWRPMVPGGIQNDTQARNILEQQANNHGGILISGSQSKVRLSGIWGTKHRTVPIPIPHRYNQERAYRARFRMSDGTEKEGFMLQGCGNDVHAGAWYVPFPGARVEEGWEDETTYLVPSVVSAVPVIEENVTDSVKFELRKSHDDQPAMVRLSGVDEKANNTIELKPGEIAIRYTPRS